jgi:hypothetical protein
MKKFNLNRIKEPYIFYSVLAINLVLLIITKFYPSMDGPFHLYNSNLICHLIKGDCPSLNNFYIFNKYLIPNWSSHIILSTFNFILPAWMAEKILLIVYLIGLTVSFRLLLKKLCPDNISLSIFIFPFAHSFLFHLGFYNYTLSFICLFFTLYFWFSTKDEHNIRKHIILFILITLTYFTSILTYCFLGLCLGLLTITSLIIEYLENRSVSILINSIFKKLLLLFIVSLPSILCFAVFYKTTIFFSTESRYSFNELIKWLNDVRPLIVYNYVGEEKITQQFLHIIIVIVSISIYLRFRDNPSKDFSSKINRNDIFLLPVLVALILFFIIPNGADAGMMSDRYCLMFYMLFIVWIVTLVIPKKVSQIIVFLIIIFHFGLLFKQFNGSIRNLNEDAKIVSKVSDRIEAGSVVLPVNISENWIEPHFSNYLGIEKPLVILENCEASVGWFPLKWNFAKLPKVLLGDKTSVSGQQWVNNTSSTTIKQIDYVFLLGNTAMIDDPQWNELKETLSAYYNLIYFTDNKYIELYRKKGGN